MRTLTHFDAVSVLREADNDVTIRIHRDVSSEGDIRQAGVVKSSHTNSLTYKQETERNKVNTNIKLPFYHLVLLRTLFLYHF